MTSLNIGALSAINIGVINDKGALETTITLEEFFRVAKSQHIYFHSNAPRGELDFDLTISKSEPHCQSERMAEAPAKEG